MDRNLFRYVWRHSRRDQIVILVLVVLSLPFYFLSLNLPKQIVNEAIQGKAFTDGRTTAKFLELSIGVPDFLGGWSFKISDGFPLPRLEYMLALSFLFLFLVLFNGGFKYYINLLKGALGERMLRRLRFDLFSAYMSFRPEAIRTVKPAEAATVIKDEVEPIGGFIGDAFIQPAFLGGQALTALLFILVQNIWLGLLTAAVVGVQALIIPRLRREQIKLGKLRQIASRKLAGRVGEVVDGMPAVRSHATARYEKSDIGSRLGELFDIRYRLFKRKFAVKYLNNLLAQVTPFLFYAVGGYFALQGTLDIGQLVAVIAAYRDLPPPVKELIDWDQQRLDVTVKYEQIMEQVSADQYAPPEDNSVPATARLDHGVIELSNVSHADQRGNALLENANLSLPIPGRIALVGSVSSGASSVARILGRDVQEFTGHVRIAGYDTLVLPAVVAGKRLAFAGADPILFPGSIRDNVLYGLKHSVVRTIERPMVTAFDRVRKHEAAITGNPTDDPADDWVDYEAAGASSPEEIDDRIIAALAVVDMDDDVYRFGLGGTIDPDRYPALAARIVEAREAVRNRLTERGSAKLVEPFDPDAFNRNATVGENLLFGVPLGDTFRHANLANNPFMRSILDAEDLSRPLTDAGLRIAETMVEIFSGLPAGHSMFERFSFIEHDELPQYSELLARWKTRRRGPESSEDRERLVALPLSYIEPRHRLGLINPELEARVIAARRSFSKLIPNSLKPAVEFYDPDRLCSTAPVRDNLLFGRVAYGVASANDQVLTAIRDVLKELDLSREVHRLGLDYQVGPAGRLLFGTQKASIHVARCLIKQPDVLILQDALSVFGTVERNRILAKITGLETIGTLVATVPTREEARNFATLVVFDGPRATGVEQASENLAAAG